MARFRRILRLSVWWCCLSCVLSVTQVSSANNRIDVDMPSPESVAKGGGLPSRSGNSLSIPGAPKQEYIPRTPNGTPGTPFKVLPRIDFSIPRTIKGAAGAMRLNPVSLAGTIGLGLALDAMDGILDPENNQIRIPSFTEPSSNPDDYYWTPNYDTKPGYPNPTLACQEYVKREGSLPFHSISKASNEQFLCNVRMPSGQVTHTPYNTTYSVVRRGKGCTGNYNVDTGECLVSSGTRPATDDDWAKFESAASGANPDWLKDLLNEHCAGSIAPQRCYEDLADNTSLSGPSSVAGPSSTSSGTYTKPDGTVGTTSTTNNTRYDIKYGNNYYNYSTTTTTTKTTDGTTTETNTSTDAGSPETQQPPKEQDKEEDKPSPCTGTNCDGPAYADLYKPTEETKEQHIDGYLSRISGIPIFQAVTGLFDVQVGGSCPVWEVHEVLPILGYNFTINLVFDFLCLPWIVSMGPWIRAVIYAVATGYAIRVAIL